LVVDWSAVAAALQHSRNGNHLKTIEVFSSLITEAESDRDRAAIVLGEATCYAQLGDLAKSRELLESAKGYAQADRDVLSQVELAEGALQVLNESTNWRVRNSSR
jgi:thioredoxin-like negative regulator of GroEL